MAISELTQRTELLRMARGAWLSHVLYASQRLGLFAALADGPADAPTVARRLGTEPEPTARLLGACVAAGLLAFDAAGYRPSPMAAALLQPGAPGYLGDWVELMGEFDEVWRSLESSVRSGKPAGLPAGQAGGAERFGLAMHQFAGASAREVADKVDLAGRRHLLDVGGGAGTYAMALVRRFPELRATVVDVPGMVALAGRVVGEAGLGDRITARAADYTRDALGTGFDAALLSNILHQEEPATCARILGGVFAALAPGGLLILHGIHVNAEGTGPLFPAMQSLLQWLLWGGRVYSTEETIGMLTGAGFEDPRVIPLSMLTGGSLLTAVKPGGTSPR